MVKKIVYYETSDGKQFLSKKDAKEHEIRLKGKVFDSEKSMFEYFVDKDEMFSLLQTPDCPPYTIDESRAYVEEAVNGLLEEYPDIYVEHEGGLRRMYLFDFMWKQLKPHVIIRHFRTSTPHAGNYTDKQIMSIYQFAESEAYSQSEEPYMFDALIDLIDSLNE